LCFLFFCCFNRTWLVISWCIFQCYINSDCVYCFSSSFKVFPSLILSFSKRSVSRKEKKKNNKTTKSLCFRGLCTVYYQLKRKEKTLKKSFPKKNNPSRVIVLCLFVVHVHVRLYVCVRVCVWLAITIKQNTKKRSPSNLTKSPTPTCSVSFNDDVMSLLKKFEINTNRKVDWTLCFSSCFISVQVWRFFCSLA